MSANSGSVVLAEADAAAAAPAAAAPESGDVELVVRDDDGVRAAEVSNARSAFSRGDVEASRAAHDAKRGHEEVHGGTGSEYIKSIVFGGLDGIITTFAIVAAVVGASLPMEVIIMMGFSNLLADGISMGLGDFLSSKAELDFIRSEHKRELWEYDNNPEGEKAEMIELYMKNGFTEEHATTIIDIYTSKPEYRSAFVDHMMVVELGHMVPDEDENPAWDGLVTFLSFVAFGSIPMWFYVIFYAAGWGQSDTGAQFGIACAATALTLFMLGFFKSRITKQNGVISGVLMMLNGSLAAASAFLVGWGLEAVLNVPRGESC